MKTLWVLILITQTGFAHDLPIIKDDEGNVIHYFPESIKKAQGFDAEVLKMADLKSDEFGKKYAPAYALIIDPITKREKKDPAERKAGDGLRKEKEKNIIINFSLSGSKIFALTNCPASPVWAANGSVGQRYGDVADTIEGTLRDKIPVPGHPESFTELQTPALVKFCYNGNNDIQGRQIFWSRKSGLKLRERYIQAATPNGPVFCGPETFFDDKGKQSKVVDHGPCKFDWGK